MSLVVAVQMDPIESIDIEADSTFMLAIEAQKRNYSLYHYLPQDLSLRNSRLTARIRPLEVRKVEGNHFTLGATEMVSLGDIDIVLMRQDPPFDMAYITATHLLEHAHPRTLVVNDPISVRNAPEKLFVTHFPDLMPPTLISTDRAEINAFREEHKDIIIKPLFGSGGAGVFHIGPEDENLSSLLGLFTKLYREPIIVQRYLPEVLTGDKRIVLIDGKPLGAFNRISPKGAVSSNLHAGGRAAPATLTPREVEICEAIGPALSEKGLIFVGIDVIGGYLTEINVTSPTGLQEITRFDDVSLEADIWDVIEERFYALRA